MMNSAESETLVQPSLAWISRNGAMFDWTAEDQQDFSRKFMLSAIFSDRRNQSPLVRILFRLVFLISTILIFSSVYALNEMRHNGIYDLNQPYAQFFLIIVFLELAAILCFLWYHKLTLKIDDKWLYTRNYVGVYGDTLWHYKHNIFYIYTSTAAFVNVISAEQAILVFINKRTVHPFPREKLAAADAGRKVLKWFATNQPTTRVALPETASCIISRDPPRRSLPFWVPVAIVALATVVIATLSISRIWHRDTTVTLTGREATDFIKNMARLHTH